MQAVVGKKRMPRPPAWGGAKASCVCQFNTNEPVTVRSLSSTTICAGFARTKVAWIGTALKWCVKSETAKCLAKYKRSW
eukprot:2479801-Amphidinium_carterae.1